MILFVVDVAVSVGHRVLAVFNIKNVLKERNYSKCLNLYKIQLSVNCFFIRRVTPHTSKLLRLKISQNDLISSMDKHSKHAR